MIGHEHVDHVEWIGVVVACADGDALLVDVVIPCTTIAVPLHALLLQVVEVVDAGSLEYIVGFSKDCPLDHALLGIIEGIAVAVVVVGAQVIGHCRAVGVELLLNHQGVGISRCLECGIEDAEVFLALHAQLVVGSAVGTRDDVGANVQDAVAGLDVALDDGRDVVEAGKADEFLFIGIDAEGADTYAAARLHRGPRGGCTVEVYLHVCFAREVES